MAPPPLSERLLTLVASAALLMFFSELLFGNEGSVEALASVLQGDVATAAAVLAEMTLWYLLMAWPLHAALTYAEVDELGGLFLAGCLYGWAAEGVVVPVVYEAIPLSFLWTSVAWHAPIDAMLGWYLVRRVLREGRGAQALGLAALWGAVWGLWCGVYFRAAAMPPWGAGEFLALAGAASLVGLPAALRVARAPAASFRPGRPELLVLAPTSILLALVHGAAAWPWSLGLLVMVGLSVWALPRRGSPDRRPLLRDDGEVSLPVAMILLLVPLVATGVYVPARASSLPLGLLTTPLVLGSAIAWLAAVLVPSRPWTSRKAPSPPSCVKASPPAT